MPLFYLKIIILLCNSLLLINMFCQQPQLPFSITINCAQPPITLNNIMDAPSQTTVTPVQVAKQVSTQETTQKIESTTKQLDLVRQQIWQSLWGKKYHLLFGVILCSAISFCCYYYSMKKFMKDDQNWVTWHGGSLENLLESVGQSQSVAEALFKEIQIRYHCWQDPIDPIQALAQFRLAIDQEINALKRYISLLSLAKNAYFHYILPIQKDQQEAEKKLGFITFLKKQFLEWVSEHNVKRLNTIL